jgi:hypothetical protein
MTESEAFQFLSKCQRLWLRQKGLMPGQIISKTWNGCFSILVSGICLLVGVTVNYSHDRGNWLWFDAFFVGFALILIGLAMWLMVRLSAARRAIAYATPGSSRLSGSR